MITIKKLIIYLFFFNALFFFTDSLKINSNDDKVFLYDESELYDEKIMDIYFIDLSSYDLIELFKGIDVDLISITVQENLYDLEKIYIDGNSIEEIVENINKYYSNKILEVGYEMESINLLSNGFKISSIKLKGIVKEIIKLESKAQII